MLKNKWILVSGILIILVIFQGIKISNLKEKDIVNSFLEDRLRRDQCISSELKILKDFMDNNSISEECKAIISSKYRDIAAKADLEVKGELRLKQQGYEDVIVYINNDKVNVIIKSKKKLSNKQIEEVKSAIIGLVGINNVEVIERNY